MKKAKTEPKTKTKSTSDLTCESNLVNSIASPSDSLLPFINPAYVQTIDKLGIHYTNSFYLAMFRLTRPPSNLSYLDAYRSLGFNTEHLGERRAVQAGYRAARYALERFFYGNNKDGDEGESNDGSKNDDSVSELTDINGKPFFDLKTMGSKSADQVMAELGIPKAIWDEFRAEMDARDGCKGSKRQS